MSLRRFKLLGSNKSGDAVIKMSIDDVEIYNGALQAENSESVVATGSKNFDNTGIISVRIELVQGSAEIGPIHWDYAKGVNPLLTPEELAYAENPLAPDFTKIPRDVQDNIQKKGNWFVQQADCFSDRYGQNSRQFYTNFIIDGVYQFDRDVSNPWVPSWVTLNASQVLEYKTSLWNTNVKNVF